MKYRRQVWKYGQSMDVLIYPIKENAPGRGKRRKPSRACQERLNKIHKADRLKRMLGINFTQGDIYFTGTYKDGEQPDSYRRACKDAKNFIARLIRARKRAGISEPFKWVFVAEQGSVSGRWHLHFIFTAGLAWEQISRLWGRGSRKSIDELYYDDEGGFKGLAYYFCKVEERAERKTEPSCPGEKYISGRLHSSRNMIKPTCTENDFEITRRKAARIAADKSGDISDIIGMTRGYLITSAEDFFNEIDGCYYLKIHLRRQENKDKGKRRRQI